MVGAPDRQKNPAQNGLPRFPTAFMHPKKQRQRWSKPVAGKLREFLQRCPTAVQLVLAASSRSFLFANMGHQSKLLAPQRQSLYGEHPLRHKYIPKPISV